jgi:hypothetical protein
VEEIDTLPENLCFVVLLDPQPLFRISAPEPPHERGIHIL